MIHLLTTHYHQLIEIPSHPFHITKPLTTITMNYSGSNSYSSTNYHSVDRDTARTLINDITYKPSADEIAAMERREADRQAAKAAKAARKAEKKSSKKPRDASSYNAAASFSTRSFGGPGGASYSTGGPSPADAYTYSSYQSGTADDKASVFSDSSSRTYSSFRSLLSRKSHNKEKR